MININSRHVYVYQQIDVRLMMNKVMNSQILMLGKYLSFAFIMYFFSFLFQDPDRVFFFFISRVGNCNANQVCCNREQIISQNTQEPDSGNNNNNYVRSCGIGLPSPRATTVENLGTRILSSEGMFRFKMYL